ncbi:hypothetical protein [Micromonospora tarensis]|uniref:Uncharacterized protein n=1 Tax=Micromonospora tarensis TaxID=2806100 RepID=A0ABS1Y9T3_9ACTN|nr:hypothetical protein [Micromonospora tarensis]MBM0274138.1 hypothetical protein [Micromonospora tarensis]
MPVPAGSGSGPAPAGLSYDPILSRVRLSVQIPSPAAYARIERSTDQVRWVTVRGGTEVVPTTGGWVTLSDYEFTPDTPNWYRVRAFMANDFEIGASRNSNPYIETDTSGWTAVGGTVARSTSTPHEGVASLLLTPDGATATVQARVANGPVTAANFYVGAAWLRSTVARTAGIAIIWRDAGGGILSQTLGSTVALAAGVWTYFEVTGQAPASATQATFVAASMGGTPPVGHTMLVDEACFVVIGGTPVFSGAITPDLAGHVWLKSVSRPFLNRAVTVLDYSDIERPARGGLFTVPGRTAPVAVTDVRSSRRWTLEVLTNDATAARDVDLLLASGDVLLVQAPAGTDVPAGYVHVGDTRQRRTSRLGPRRVFELPCTEVAAPTADVVGATATCQTVLNTYATCAALLAAHPTCLSVMELIGDPTEVIVP